MIASDDDALFHRPKFKPSSFAGCPSWSGVPSNRPPFPKYDFKTSAATASNDEFSFSEYSSDVIVIQPGSLNLRIGLASHSIPRKAPHVICRPSATTTLADDVINDDVSEFIKQADSFLSNKLKVEKTKHITVFNAHAAVATFNATVKPVLIEDHNDPGKVEWIQKVNTCHVGEDVYSFDFVSNPEYKTFYPLKYGRINYEGYQNGASITEQFKFDIFKIWSGLLEKEFKINSDNYSNYKALVILENGLDLNTLDCIACVLLTDFKFSHVSFVQEAVSATFGASMNLACVVDVGYSKTSVSCVEDALLYPESRMDLSWGGNDVTKLLAQLLLQRAGFVHNQINMSDDWRMLEYIKRFCILNSLELEVKHFEFFVRRFGKKTRKYDLKLYDELMLAPLMFFFPKYLFSENKLCSFSDTTTSSNSNSKDDKNGYYKPPIEIVRDYKSLDPPETNDNTAGVSQAGEELIEDDGQECIDMDMPSSSKSTQLLSIEEAIVNSIQSLSKRVSEETISRLYNSILLTGAGLTNYYGLSSFLTERIRNEISLRGVLRDTTTINIILNPREMPAESITWKGGCVFARLESYQDRSYWSNLIEYEYFGAELLNQKILTLEYS